MTSKIAIPYSPDGEIFQHFGKTELFKLYTVADGKVTAGEVADAASEGHELLAIWLIQNEVDTVICGGIGPGALGMLAAARIKVLAGVEGKADDAVAQFIDGKLAATASATCRHDEGHSCGGSCSHCGHHCH